MPRQEVFVQFLYKGSRDVAADIADRLADEILTNYDVETVSVVVESIENDDSN